jgi:hypothetical protein
MPSKRTPGPRKSLSYDERVERLCKIIQAAEDVIKAAKDVPATEKRSMLEWGHAVEELALNPASPRLRTARSIDSLQNDFLGTGTRPSERTWRSSGGVSPGAASTSRGATT